MSDKIIRQPGILSNPKPSSCVRVITTYIKGVATRTAICSRAICLANLSEVFQRPYNYINALQPKCATMKRSILLHADMRNAVLRGIVTLHAIHPIINVLVFRTSNANGGSERWRAMIVPKRDAVPSLIVRMGGIHPSRGKARFGSRS